MITKFVENSMAFKEFSSEAQKDWFEVARDKVSAHIDTLYYTVSIQNDSTENPLVNRLTADLQELRNKKRLNPSVYVEFDVKDFKDKVVGKLEFKRTTFVHYEYCLSLNENFEIFISSTLPNNDTPRIVVQLRTRSLILDGAMQAVCKSFGYVKKILAMYCLYVGDVYENRIDYAFHTNIIQNPYKFFSDERIAKTLKSKLRIYHKVGNIHGGRIDIDYFSLGNRNSNNVFVRVYNKSQEVVEKNYKSFFFTRWLDEKLINKYDHYVYSKAYTYKSYRTGMFLGRIDWYLEYGSNEAIKKELLECVQSNYENSDNIDQLEKIVNKYLPPVTLIMNIEFQTKRKFYYDCDEWLSMYGIATKKMFSYSQFGFVNEKWLPLYRLHNIYSLRSEICNYLTSVTVAFVDNKGKKEETLCYWWKRINEVYIEEYAKKVLDLYRIRENHLDSEKSKRRLCSSLAHFYMVKKNTLDDKSNFTEDISDVLCYLNDNDFYGFAPNPETGKIPEMHIPEYLKIKKRNSRQLKGIIENKTQ